MRRLAIAVIASITFIVAACDGRDRQRNADAIDSVGMAPVDSTSEERQAGGLTDTTSEALGGDEWTVDARSEQPNAREIAYVGDVRVDEHEAFDRLVVEFDTIVAPGFRIEYTDGEARECGSGREIETAGAAVLEMRLEPAQGYTDDGRSSVSDRQRELSLGVLRELYVSCDFEAVFTIVLGVESRRPFRVFRLDDPGRIVVDVRKDSV